jgi:LysR family hydrogen peroxide-inducible transcriptional activator
MELHQLRYFVALAQTGNFSRAAEVCHVTQPSLSQQIKKLEEELEEPLLVRRMNKSRTTLTEAGEILLSLAQRVLAEVEAAYRAMEDLSDLTRGSITMGVIPTIAPYFLPELISAFQDKYPQLRLELREDHTEALLAQLRAGDIHVAILSPPVAGEFVVYPLFEEALFLCVCVDSEWVKRHEVSLEDLKAEPFLLLHQDHCLSGQVEEFCVHQEVSLNTVFRSSQLETIKSMVRSGNGLSLMPEMAIDRERSNGLGYVSVKPRLARKIAIVHHRDQLLSRAVTAFLNFVQTQFGRVSESAG